MVRLWALAIAAVTAAAGADFESDVKPVLAKRCAGCHGAAQEMAGLRLDGGMSLAERGVVKAGDSAGSSLLQRVTSTKPGVMMPPAGPRLSEAEIATIKSWIDGGASMPAIASRPTSKHWAFQPVRRPAVPQVARRDWTRNPIDAFILAKLEAKDVAPSPEASKTTLLRRASFDLTGLPPTPADVEAFLADARPDAYERAIDRLLASPHYGERWARSWLDLVRYADSDGYEKDLVRPWAWRYRNWVIDALNHDMPFDRFTLEQIAGDLLPHPTVEQRVATGLYRHVLTNREAGVDREEARFEQDVNRANTLSTVWLGLTTGCAQCHNHKYDPISQRDYYGLMAWSANLEEDDIDAPMPGEIGPFMKAWPDYIKARNAILAEYEVLKLQAKYEERLRVAVENPGADLEWDFQVTEFRAGMDNAVKVLNTPWEKRTFRQQSRMTSRFLRVFGPDLKDRTALTDRLKEAREKLSKLDATVPVLTEAMAIRENGDAPETTVRTGGDYRAKGDKVSGAVPAFLGAPSLKSRLDLARWLVSADNPLTARVAANRMWNEFFGRGLVRTTEDFGTQGEKPTHPELLDWLAVEFREGGWSMKRMHKLIVTSAAYRQSSYLRRELLASDPENTLVARQNRLRLTAEAVRDAALAAGGLLNTAIGGKSVRPPQPAGVAELGYANSVKWVESQGLDRYRRGLYIHFQRTAPYPMLMTFDAPDSNVACTRRTRTNTPLQALNLLNDPVFLEAAQGLALRTLREAAGDRIEYAFRLTAGRSPSEREKARLGAYLEQQRAFALKDAAAAGALMPYVPEGIPRAEAAAWIGVARVLLNLDEFITRE